MGLQDGRRRPIHCAMAFKNILYLIFLSKQFSSVSANVAVTNQPKKSIFEKIGTRKLIRVKPSGKDPRLRHPNASVQKINSPVVAVQSSRSRFKKIGTKKLVRVKSIGLLTTPPVNSPGRYKLKTKSKIIVRTPRSILK